jgi:uncharacterized sodium:solute symporter family permease YidK
MRIVLDVDPEQFTTISELAGGDRFIKYFFYQAAQEKVTRTLANRDRGSRGMTKKEIIKLIRPTILNMKEEGLL